MSIASEITRIQTAKANIKTAIEAKGVAVPSTTKIDGYPTLIGQISGGGRTVYDIAVTTTNVTAAINNPTIIEANHTATLLFTANSGCVLPSAVTVTGATGTWTQASGTLVLSNPTGNVTVSVTGEAAIIAGLYDANDNILATYAESGLIVDVNYTYGNYKTERGSGYSTIARYPTTTKIILPNSVTSIGKLAFYACTGLTSVTIGESVESIGESAFCKLTGLTSITIPNSVTSIGESAFWGCTGLTSVTIGNSVTSIDLQAFYKCTGLTSVTIGESVESIGESAFWGCTGLTSVTIIGNGVTSIGKLAFSDCMGLTSVTIGNGVKSIGDGAFSACTGFTSITIPDSVTSISSSAFNYCHSLRDIYVAWSEGEVANAPWGATNATIHYNYTPS